MAPTDLTVELLRQIRDNVHEMRVDFTARLDGMNSRLDDTNRRLDQTRTELIGIAEENGRRIEDNGRRIQDNGRRIEHLEKAVLEMIGHLGTVAQRVTVLEDG